MPQRDCRIVAEDFDAVDAKKAAKHGNAKPLKFMINSQPLEPGAP